VEIDDHPVVAQGEAWIQDHFARSRPVTAAEASSRAQRWLLDPLGRLVARLADAIGRTIAGGRRAPPGDARRPGPFVEIYDG
jgi:hypothetical protein